MDNDLSKHAEKLIALALLEDLGTRGDITGLSLAGLSAPCQAQIIAKQSGVIAGLEVAKQVFKTISTGITFQRRIYDGQRCANGDIVAEITGTSLDILKAERTALNFLQRLSGIATLTSQYVVAVAGTGAKILDTRKTTPGMRMLEKYAVVQGGGSNHRSGLYDMILIKENHIAAAGSIESAIKKCKAYLTEQGLQVPVEIEISAIAQLYEVLAIGVDRIMLDNMSTQDIKTAVAKANYAAELEASGGITLENIREIAETGVDFISVGALTHSAPAFDLSLLITG